MIRRIAVCLVFAALCIQASAAGVTSGIAAFYQGSTAAYLYAYDGTGGQVTIRTSTQAVQASVTGENVIGSTCALTFKGTFRTTSGTSQSCTGTIAWDSSTRTAHSLTVNGSAVLLNLPDAPVSGTVTVKAL